MQENVERTNHVSLFLHENSIAHLRQVISELEPGRALLLRMASLTRLVSLISREGNATSDLVLEYSVHTPLSVLQVMVGALPGRCTFRPAYDIPGFIYQASISALPRGTIFRPAINTPVLHVQLACAYLPEGCLFTPALDMPPFRLPAFFRLKRRPESIEGAVFAGLALGGFDDSDENDSGIHIEDLARLSLNRRPTKRCLDEELDEAAKSDLVKCPRR